MVKLSVLCFSVTFFYSLQALLLLNNFGFVVKINVLRIKKVISVIYCVAIIQYIYRQKQPKPNSRKLEGLHLKNYLATSVAPLVVCSYIVVMVSGVSRSSTLR